MRKSSTPVPAKAGWTVTAALALGLAAPGVAAAEYICAVGYDPGHTQYGEDGRIWISFAKDLACKDQAATMFLCSPNPTGPALSYCAKKPYQYTREELLTHLESLRAAADTGQRVSPRMAPCADTGRRDCLGYVSFYGN